MSAIITQQFLHELITCPKRAIGADRRKMLLTNRSYRNNVSLISLDEKYSFKMFLRQSDEFQEDFSVGLIWTNTEAYVTKGKDVILIRYQGPHDSGKPIGIDTHHDFHVHEITVADIDENRHKKPSHKNITNKFYSFSSALVSFVQDCGIIDLEQYIEYNLFPSKFSGQISLF